MAYLFKCYTLPMHASRQRCNRVLTRTRNMGIYVALCLLYNSMVSKIFKITYTDSWQL